jgi:hypothetical protein
LQEVDRKAKRTGGVDQAAEYARLTTMHAWYGAAMPFQGGEYGQLAAEPMAFAGTARGAVAGNRRA